MNHYRIYDMSDEMGNAVLSVEIFYTVKETPCGYWVVSEYTPDWFTFRELKKHKKLRFVNKSTIKKYCYPTIDDAIDSFIKRKFRQLAIIKSQYERVKQCIDNVDKYQNASIDDFKNKIELIPQDISYSLTHRINHDTQ